mgnify:CR=1 FL=1
MAREGVAQGALILEGAGLRPDALGVEVVEKSAQLGRVWQIVEEQRCRLPPEHPPARRGQAHAHAELDACLVDPASGALEDLLAGRVDADHPALARAAALGDAVAGAVEGARHVVGDGEAAGDAVEQALRNARAGAGDDHPDPRGGREGIALDVVDVEDHVRAGIDARDVLVGAVAAAIDAMELGLEGVEVGGGLHLRGHPTSRGRCRSRGLLWSRSVGR